ncbi:esterase family protein [Micrococcus sp.]|uniref:alpha/beta hydrolase n=1 Tax=Micrococcus sp. TaxID=1271 RepID=UPI0026DD3A48|nr:alpha/beta hydrolase-fold protein [Micrococcus sp.]MDO4238849.1 alpha/beta hydrolase-fold protein [Micrococcus sp.]
MDLVPVWLLDTPLLAPGVAPAALAAALAVVAGLWAWRTRRLPVGVQAAIVLVPAALAVLGWWVVDRVWQPVADGVSPLVFAWVALALVVLGQVLAGPWRPAPARWGAAGVVGTLVTALCLALGVNAHYATYESLGVLTGSNVTWTAWDRARPAPARTVVPAAAWRAPADLPEHGTVSPVALPAADPGFHPRDAVVYLPPAYRADPRPALPVIVLMAGVPGHPSDWFGPGRAAETLDAYAAAHGGIAPIVVSVDPLGGTLVNPLCSDGPHGDVAAYVAQDVPAWVQATLQVDPDRAHWAVGGISNGATCALQTVARTPDAYGTALVLSGELHPDLGGEERTVVEGFAGDRAAYEANDPLSLFAAAERGVGPGADGAYRDVAGIASVGEGDTYVGPPVPQELAAAAGRAGLDLQVRTYPGGHTWSVWSRAFEDQLPWAAERMGLR